MACPRLNRKSCPLTLLPTGASLYGLVEGPSKPVVKMGRGGPIFLIWPPRETQLHWLCTDSMKEEEEEEEDDSVGTAPK